ncbi:hypothetical protein [Chitinophaga sp.]|uniref:hypothetical protein n=1 Tax=Chitinophaga sp. TaxID=1869181 RepID=UPI0031DAA30D
MNKNLLQRRIVTTKDIQVILGKSARSARDFMKRMREHFNKKPGQYISVSEFCEFSGLTEAEVVDFFSL